MWIIVYSMQVYHRYHPEIKEKFSLGIWQIARGCPLWYISRGKSVQMSGEHL
jgi:hypothetical protein